MAKAPAYQMYAADFAMATLGWPADDVCAHIRLMNSQWINDGLPDDLQELAGISGLSLRKLRKVWERLEVRYPVCADGRRRNSRLESERQKQQEYREMCSRAGKASAAQRAFNGGTNGRSTEVPTEGATETQHFSLQSSTSTSNQNQKQERATRLPHDFCVTPAHRYFALENNLPVPDDHIAQFRDYWIGVAGQRGKKLDWDATFRNWLRKATEFKGRAHGERKAQISQDQQRRDFEQLMAESLDGEGDSQATVPQRGLLPDSGAKARSSGGLVAISSTAGSGKV